MPLILKFERHMKELAAPQPEHDSKKILRNKKLHVIGTGEKPYVLLQFLTALWFCSMFRFRGDTSRVSTKSGLGDVKRGPGWIWHKSGRPV